MNIEQLNRLSTETLKKLQESISTVLDSRLDTRPSIGATGFFQAGDGTTRHGTIIKINTKTFSVIEASDSPHKPGTRWSVSKVIFHIDPRERVNPTDLPKAVVPHKPKTQAGPAW